jgi:MoaA/NifB/PqqE/SkfB family radical SAM enzyme
MANSYKLKTLYLDVVQRCNLSCIMCDVPRTNKDMDTGYFLDYFRRNECHIPNLEAVAIGHQAESTLNPNLFEIVRFFKKRGIRVDLVTNGTRLHNTVSAILDSNLDGLFISVDSHDSVTLEGIRKGIRAEKLFGSIRELSRRRIGKPSIYFAFCAMRRNIGDLPDVVELAASVGAKQICFQFMIAGKAEMFQESLFFFQDQANTFMRKAEERALELGVMFNPRYFMDDGYKAQASIRRSYCHMPFDTLYINGVGECFVCYFKKVGDIKTDSIADIWKGGELEAFRDQVMTPGSIHCQNCGFCEVQSPSHLETFFPPHIIARVGRDTLSRLIGQSPNNPFFRDVRRLVYPEPIHRRGITKIYSRASALEKAGRFNDSLELFRDLLNCLLDRDQRAGVHFHLGMNYKHLGDSRSARSHFIECLTHVPDHKEAAIQLAMAV